MAKKRKWGRVLAFGAVTAALGGIAAYMHRKEIEQTLQEIADQMDAWEGSGEFFGEQDNIVHTVTTDADQSANAPVEEAVPNEHDFVDTPETEQEDKPEETPEV